MAVNESALLQTSPMHSWIGIVAADKKPNETTINVMIPELTPVATGAVGVATANQSVQLTDINGNTINSNVKTGNTITAYYMGGRTNVKYPPDVVKGEQVRITKLANADRFYWESMGRDDAMRKTETHRIEVANRTDHTDPTDDDHTYSVELDSKTNQHVRIQTSKANGEKFAYVVKLDGKNGQLQMSDDAGNSVVIDSANDKVILRNAKKSFVLLNGEDITLAAPRDVTIKAGRQMLLTGPLITVNAMEGTGIIALVANAIVKSAKSLVMTVAPSIGLNGAVQIPQNLKVTKIKSQTGSSGSIGARYPVPTINLSSGTGNIGSVTPDT